ncbi:uncharacterized protein LOC126968177 [Leptidea sinapis]|uniref:uncharacterized protein LOC126968177 n=1 Tax=Leptidea sinapis TaxID=189913 RepID=UPI0021C49DF6|nr:uncharacterized protein LOC126968177 [Leptidea sinapis]
MQKEHRGHKAHECWSKVDRVNKNNASICCLEETCLNTSDNKEKNKKWCLDSGCTSHMSHELKRFINMDKADNKTLRLASENCLAQIEGRGPAKLYTYKIPNLKLTEALYVPSLTTNLMSVRKITDKGGTVLFKQKNAIVMRNNKILLKALRHSVGLYYVNENIEEKANYCEASKMQQWHRKLAHLNEGQMRIALDKKIMEGLEFNKSDTVKDCEVCAKGKATKLPFNAPKNEQQNVEDNKDLKEHEIDETDQELNNDEIFVDANTEIDPTSSTDKRQRKPPAWHQD